MNNPFFSDKDLDIIRQIAIKLFLDTNPDGKIPDAYKLQMVAEATVSFLKRTDRLKDENL